MSIRNERKQQSRQTLIDSALKLSTHSSFSSVSLREVTREAGLVPTAFYRHFQDMRELGEALVEETAQTLQQLLARIKEGFLEQHITVSKSQFSLSQFFLSVEIQPLHWSFIIVERWGGDVNIRGLISIEVQKFHTALTLFLSQLDDFKHMTEEDIAVFCDILINLFFSWGMSWIKLPDPLKSGDLEQQRAELFGLASKQTQLLFRGISHWKSH